MWDEEKQQAAALPNCPPAWEGPAKCDPLRDAWCHEGLVAYNRTNGPVLMTYSGACASRVPAGVEGGWRRSAMTRRAACALAASPCEPAAHSLLRPAQLRS